MYKVYQVFSTANSVELSIFHLFYKYWRISLDRIQVGFSIGIRLYKYTTLEIHNMKHL